MLVKEHIRKNIITISQDKTFREALVSMVENKTNGMIVIDDDGKPVGTIDSFTLIQNMTPSYLQEHPELAQYEPEGVFYKALSRSLNKKVADMMVDLHGVQVKEDDPMILAATLASKYDFRYIPVLDKEEKLVGLVSRTDIKRAMAELIDIKDSSNK
ncbi:HPP family protein [Patescibacteria group bacterium]